MKKPGSEHPSTRSAASRFTLPTGDISPGRSQPKRIAPKRGASKQLTWRVAMGVATFGVSLALVAVVYGLMVSASFRGVTLENGTTAAVALLIGCFTLSSTQRAQLSSQRNLWVCVAVLAITPWTYQLGNTEEAAGMDLATGFNFIFEILLATVFYRLAARLPHKHGTAR